MKKITFLFIALVFGSAAFLNFQSFYPPTALAKDFEISPVSDAPDLVQQEARKKKKGGKKGKKGGKGKGTKIRTVGAPLPGKEKNFLIKAAKSGKKSTINKAIIKAINKYPHEAAKIARIVASAAPINMAPALPRRRPGKIRS